MTSKKRKEVHFTPDQLKQASRDYAAAHASLRPVSGASRETLDDVNAFLSGVDTSPVVEEPVAPSGGDIFPGNTLLLTVADLCALLQISRTTLFRMERFRGVSPLAVKSDTTGKRSKCGYAPS